MNGQGSPTETSDSCLMTFNEAHKTMHIQKASRQLSQYLTFKGKQPGKTIKESNMKDRDQKQTEKKNNSEDIDIIQLAE